MLDLYEAALADFPDAGALAIATKWRWCALGGYGRRDVAPYSDVDLMILHDRTIGALMEPLAKRLMHDLFDVGFAVGQSVRTSGRGLQAGDEGRHDLHVADRIAISGRQRAALREIPPPLSARLAPPLARTAQVPSNEPARRSARNSARRSICWSRTSSARPGRCATFN